MIKHETMSEIEFIDIFSDNLRELMLEHNITQMELADEILVNRSTITRYLNKSTMPSIKALINLSIVFNCDIEDLIPTYDLIN